MSDLAEQLETPEAHRVANGIEWLQRLALDLHRRRVYRAVVTYVIVVWIVLQIADVTFPLFGIPDAALKVIACLAAVGLPLAVVVAWIYQLTPTGIAVDRCGPASSFGVGQDCGIALVAVGGAAVLLFLMVVRPDAAEAPKVAIAAIETAQPGAPALSIGEGLEIELHRQLHPAARQAGATLPDGEKAAFVLWIHLTSCRERVRVKVILFEAYGGASPPFVYAFDLPRGSARETERQVTERIASHVRPRLTGGPGRLGGFLW